MSQQTLALAEAAVPEIAASAVDTVRLVPRLLSIGKSTRAMFGLKLAEIGFYNGQDELMLAVDPDRQVCVSQLADLLCVRPSTISKMLDRLIDKGYVKRVSHLKDARRTMVEITPAGVEAQQRIRHVWDEVETELGARMSDEELDGLVGELAKLEKHLTARLMRLR